jgi:hypothetical protein
MLGGHLTNKYDKELAHARRALDEQGKTRDQHMPGGLLTKSRYD